MSDELRVVMLGKTGSGKSSLGNTLLGRGEVYPVARGLLSGTEKCQWADTTLPSGLNLQEENMAYRALTNLFGQDIHYHMIIVFTGADVYGSTIDQQEEKLRTTMLTCPPVLKEILSDAQGRFMGVNNLAEEAERRVFADKLVCMMQDLAASKGGRHFSDKLCEEVNKVVEPLKRDNGKSKLDAAKAVNEDIVQEGSSWLKIQERFADAVKLHVFRAVKAIPDFSFKRCSVM